jgi:membrane protease YdiL (CAAX protease family)
VQQGLEASGVGGGPARRPRHRGACWAAALIGIVAAVYLIGALLPFTRELFSDSRDNTLTGLQVADRVLICVPIGTVMLEEIAFRGVLLALLLRVVSRTWATAISSLLFGLWRILPVAPPGHPEARPHRRVR